MDMSKVLGGGFANKFNFFISNRNVCFFIFQSYFNNVKVEEDTLEKVFFQMIWIKFVGMKMRCPFIVGKVKKNKRFTGKIVKF